MILRIVFLILTAALALPAAAHTFPSRPVRIVVGFTPGGGVDINARMLVPRYDSFGLFGPEEGPADIQELRAAVSLL